MLKRALFVSVALVILFNRCRSRFIDLSDFLKSIVILKRDRIGRFPHVDRDLGINRQLGEMSERKAGAATA